MSEIRTGRVAANDLEFPFLEAGPADGPLVLCLHGFPDHPRSWRLLLPELAEAGFRAVAPALRGYAPSCQPADGAYPLAAVARDTLAVGRALGAARLFLVGHDWGAAAAAAAAALEPERVRRLVTLAVPHGTFGPALLSSYDQQRRSWYMFFFQLPIAALAVQANDFAFLDRLWRDWSPGYRLPAAERKALVETFSQPGVLEAALAYYRAALGTAPPAPAWAEDQARSAGPVQVPALHLHGADDGCIGPEVCQGMEPFFPHGLRKVILDDAGHFLHLEQPQRVAAEVLDFLRKDREASTP